MAFLGVVIVKRYFRINMSCSTLKTDELEIDATKVIEVNDSVAQPPTVWTIVVMPELKIASLDEKSTTGSAKEQPISSNPTQTDTCVVPNCQKTTPEKQPLEDDASFSLQPAKTDA